MHTTNLYAKILVVLLRDLRSLKQLRAKQFWETSDAHVPPKKAATPVAEGAFSHVLYVQYILFHRLSRGAGSTLA